MPISQPYDRLKQNQRTALFAYVSCPEMFSKTPANGPQPNVPNSIGPFTPDNGGHPRTFVDKTSP